MNKVQFSNLKKASKKRPIFFTPNTIKTLLGSLLIVIAYISIKNFSLREVFVGLVSVIAVLLAISLVYEIIQYFRAQYYYSRFPLLVEEIKEMNIENLGEYISLLSNIYIKFGYIPNNYKQFNETVSSSILDLIDNNELNSARILFGDDSSKARINSGNLDIFIGTKACKDEIFKF